MGSQCGEWRMGSKSWRSWIPGFQRCLPCTWMAEIMQGTFLCISQIKGSLKACSMHILPVIMVLQGIFFDCFRASYAYSSLPSLHSFTTSFRCAESYTAISSIICSARSLLKARDPQQRWPTFSWAWMNQTSRAAAWEICSALVWGRDHWKSSPTHDPCCINYISPFRSILHRVC